MNIEDYRPINWDMWRERWRHGGKGRGQNIVDRLSDKQRQVWESIAFKGKNSIESFFNTVGRLEADDEIFTCFYEPGDEGERDVGTFFLNPHKAEVKGVGGQAWYHPVVTPEQNESLTYEGFFEKPLEGIPRRGEFDWGKYF